MTWHWETFVGSKAALRLNRRDLVHLDRVISQAQRRRVAVQAGGHLGIFPKKLAETFQSVYTFEPAPELFANLMKNAPEANIIKFQAALGGDTRRTVGLRCIRRDESPKPIHEGLTHVFGDGPYPTLFIDDLGLKVCDLIQLDLEGDELRALRGATKTIEACRPVLCIEVNKNQRFVGIETEFLRDTIKALGYRFIERMFSDELYVPAEWPVSATA